MGSGHQDDHEMDVDSDEQLSPWVSYPAFSEEGEPIGETHCNTGPDLDPATLPDMVELYFDLGPVKPQSDEPTADDEDRERGFLGIQAMLMEDVRGEDCEVVGFRFAETPEEHFMAFYAYARDGEATRQKIAALIERGRDQDWGKWFKYHGIGQEIRVESDPDWSYYHSVLYPTPSDWQYITDEEMLMEFEEAGFDMEEPRDFEHELRFGDEVSRTAFLTLFKEEVGEDGFEFELYMAEDEEDEDEGEDADSEDGDDESFSPEQQAGDDDGEDMKFGLRIHNSDMPLVDISSISTVLAAMAADSGGSYLGWVCISGGESDDDGDFEDDEESAEDEEGDRD